MTPSVTPATVSLSHLDGLWLQVTGTLCNLACTHCFNSSGPGVRTFTQLEPEEVSRELRTAAAMGVKEIFFTGGEPFLHPQLTGMLREALEVAPTTVLTNGTMLREAMVAQLALIERAARYSLEIRISLDGYTAESNDAIRGAGVFHRVLDAVACMSRHRLLPLVTIVRTWPEEEELDVIAGFVRTLEEAGYARPRLKILPPLPLGRAIAAVPHLPGATPHTSRMRDRSPISVESAEEPRGISIEMMQGFDADLLMCSNSRIITSRGVWVCPLLVEIPEARMGGDLASSAGGFSLAHHACETCYHYGSLCSNVSSGIEGLPAMPQAPDEEK